MKTRLLHRLGLASTAITILCGSALANTFHLRDGSTFEGAILDEREDSYLVERLVRPGIKDEITIAKDEVVKIDRELPGQAEFDEIKSLMPIRDILSTTEYEQRITLIREFIASHPQSEYLEQAEEILKLHLEEFEVVEAGGIKLSGQLIAAEDRLENKYYIDSRIAKTEVLRLVHTSDRLNALRAFKKFEEAFSGSEAWHSLLPVIRHLANIQQSRAQELIEGLAVRQARQESGLTRMPTEERQSSLRAIAEREAFLKQRHDAERSMKDYWPSMSANYKPSIDDTIRFAQQEIRRLETAAAQPLRQPTPSQLWRNAFTAIQSGDAGEIRTAMQAVRTMPQHYRDELDKLAAQQAAQQAAHKAAEQAAEQAAQQAAEQAAEEVE